MLTLAAVSEVLPVMIIGGGLFIAVISILLCNIRGMLTARSVEQSRRELAAYVAEGTMTPDEAERLLKAGPTASRQGGC